MHQHPARLAVHRECGQDHVLGRGIIPLVAGRLLEMPDIFAGFWPKRQNRRNEQIIAVAGRAYRLVPVGGVAGADIEQVQLGIIGHRIPRGAPAAAAVLMRPPFPRPGLRGELFQRLVRYLAVGLAGIAGHDVKTPDLGPGVRIIGADITPRAKLRAAVADDHPALHDPRRAGDRVVALGIGGLHRPDLGTAAGVDRDQATIDRSDIHPPVPIRSATIDDIAADLDRRGARNLRIELPQQPTARRIESLDLGPRARREKLAIDGQRCRFLSAIGIEVIGPGQPQLAHIIAVYLIERTEPRLIIAAPGRKPVLRLSIRIDDARAKARFGVGGNA